MGGCLRPHQSSPQFIVLHAWLYVCYFAVFMSASTNNNTSLWLCAQVSHEFMIKQWLRLKYGLLTHFYTNHRLFDGNKNKTKRKCTSATVRHKGQPERATNTSSARNSHSGSKHGGIHLLQPFFVTHLMIVIYLSNLKGLNIFISSISISLHPIHHQVQLLLNRVHTKGLVRDGRMPVD